MDGPTFVTLAGLEELRARFADDPLFDWPGDPSLNGIRGNPHQRPDDPLVFVLYADGEPAAKVNSIRDAAVFGGESVPWMWVGNQVTRPAHRGKGLMSALFRYMFEVADERGINVGGAGTRPGGRAVYLKAGMTFWGLCPRRVLPLRVDPFVAHRVRGEGLAGALSALPNLALSGLRAGVELSLSAGSGGHRVRVLDEVDERIPSLFEDVEASPRFDRSLEKLRWRWGRCLARRAPPGRDYRLAAIESRTDGRLAGYLMLRAAAFDEPGGLPARDLRLATVLDWAVRGGGPAPARALVRAAIDLANEMGAHALDFGTSDAAMNALLARRGFLHQGGYRLFYRAAAGGPLAGRSPEDLSGFWWHGADPEDVFTW